MYAIAINPFRAFIRRKSTRTTLAILIIATCQFTLGIVAMTGEFVTDPNAFFIFPYSFFHQEQPSFAYLVWHTIRVVCEYPVAAVVSIDQDSSFHPFVMAVNSLIWASLVLVMYRGSTRRRFSDNS